MRLQVQLGEEEGEALTRLSEIEVRDPRDQIRVLVRGELERRGFLPSRDVRATTSPSRAPADGTGIRRANDAAREA